MSSSFCSGACLGISFGKFGGQRLAPAWGSEPQCVALHRDSMGMLRLESLRKNRLETKLLCPDQICLVTDTGLQYA
jgi:hypothetical protein